MTGHTGWFHGLGDAARLRIVELLAHHGELSVNQLVCQLNVPQPAISKHLRVLRDGNVVCVRKQGVRRFYSLDTASMTSVRHFLANLPHTSTV
ncbi:ArsR/SmtB family transcription factor [Arthrobacter sp. GCM10027362]|uniref:ArsR/SmtB family transcription factor n=1 Tax=Arthrobacter sp. GCM10027362 TaxID=3273379 RepID=UPI00363C2A54